jgi:hypothetical protein
MAKFLDSSGKPSDNAAMVVSTVADLDGLNVVETQTENPAFTGTKTNVVYDSVLGGLKLDSALTISQMPGNISTWPNLSALGGITSSGTYVFSLPDLGGVYPCKVSNLLTVAGYNAADTIASRGNVSTWPSVTGGVVDDVSAAMYIRTTNDNPSGSPVYGEWIPFLSAEFSMRHAQCMLQLASANTTHNVVATALSVQVDMPDRVESAKDITSGAGTYSVTFANAFKGIPSGGGGFGITGNNLSSGDYWEITNKTVNGFDIVFKNSGGAAVSRVFDYSVKGYGKKVA